jgi:hypothetical protein
MRFDSRRWVLAVLVAVLALGARPAAAETTICTVISSLPYTINAQGSYCLDRNLSTPQMTGNAITINVDFVVLDLNGFKVGGGAAGLGTQANGVFSQNHKNITVKNGNIRGFLRAVYLKDTSGTFTSSQGHLVEDVRADQNTFAGIVVEGRGNLVRNNQVVDTTGTTFFGSNSDIFGLLVNGPGSRVINNDSTETVAVGSGTAYGIQLSSAEGAVVENNRVGNSNLASGSTAIALNSGDDVLVVGNRMATMDNGVVFVSATGKYRDNITSGVTTPYTAGTDAGNNQ